MRIMPPDGNPMKYQLENDLYLHLKILFLNKELEAWEFSLLEDMYIDFIDRKVLSEQSHEKTEEDKSKGS